MEDSYPSPKPCLKIRLNSTTTNCDKKVCTYMYTGTYMHVHVQAHTCTCTDTYMYMYMYSVVIVVISWLVANYWWGQHFWNFSYENRKYFIFWVGILFLNLPLYYLFFWQFSPPASWQRWRDSHLSRSVSHHCSNKCWRDTFGSSPASARCTLEVKAHATPLQQSRQDEALPLHDIQQHKHHWTGKMLHQKK